MHALWIDFLWFDITLPIVLICGPELCVYLSQSQTLGEYRPAIKTSCEGAKRVNTKKNRNQDIIPSKGVAVDISLRHVVFYYSNILLLYT